VTVVLVVDDDASIRGLICAALAGPRRELVEARDGNEALEKAGRLRPDLVVLDWRLPGATGFEVLTELKRGNPALKVVFVSAELRSSEGGLAHVFGADAFLEKPFSTQQLCEVVDVLLGDGEVDQAT
jgi:DNA-binding response OmpR family regulator